MGRRSTCSVSYKTTVTTNGCILEVSEKKDVCHRECLSKDCHSDQRNLPSSLALESSEPCRSKGGGVKYDTRGRDAVLSEMEGGDTSFLNLLRLVGVFGVAVSELGRLDDGGGEEGRTCYH